MKRRAPQGMLGAAIQRMKSQTVLLGARQRKVRSCEPDSARALPSCSSLNCRAEASVIGDKVVDLI